MKIKHEFKSTLAETLVVPLYMRAKESKRPDAILKDKLAEKLVSEMDYDFSSIKTTILSENVCAIRSWYLDEVTQRFIQNHDRPIIVNVGCGLDTRAQRVGDAGKAIFYELDLPEVIELRKQLIPETATNKYIATSMLQAPWMEKVHNLHPDGQFLIIAEGVAMLFYENQIKTFLSNAADHFAGGEVWIDVLGQRLAKYIMNPKTNVKKKRVKVRFSLTDGHLPEKWDFRLTLIEQVHYMKYFPKRWGFFWGRIIGRMPKFCYTISSIIGYSL